MEILYIDQKMILDQVKARLDHSDDRELERIAQGLPGLITAVEEELYQVGSQAPFVSKPTLRARSIRFSKENSESRLRRHDRAVHTLLPRRFDELRHDPQILRKRGRREPVCHQRVPRNPLPRGVPGYASSKRACAPLE